MKADQQLEELEKLLKNNGGTSSGDKSKSTANYEKK